jgi:ribosomal protein S27AE
MLSKSFRESAHLFDSLDALHHGRVLLLSGVTWLVAWVLWAGAGLLLSQQGWAPPTLLVLALGVIVLIWGGNAAGIMTMDELALRPPRPWSVLWRHALSASQQMVVVLLTVILCSLLTLLALTLLLLICRLPMLGPWLYAVVLPLATVIAAVVLFVFPVFVLALSAPAIWCGVDASTSLIQIWSVIRRRLPTATAWLIVMTAITATTCLLLVGVLALGFWLVNAMSVSLLGMSGVWPTGLFVCDGFLGAVDSDHANADVVAIKALVCTVVGSIGLRGISLVYRHVLTGLDTAPEQQFVQAALTGAHKGLRPFHTHTSLQPAAASAGGATSPSLPPSDFAPSTTSHQDSVRPSDWWAPPIGPQSQSVDIDLEVPARRLFEGKRTCPACGSSAELTDFYCGECGKSLR